MTRPARTIEPASGPSSDSDGQCARTRCRRRRDGTLTIATDKPAFQPWFVDDKPANGKGFEGAVAYAVAESSASAEAEVTWIRAVRQRPSSRRRRKVDLDINQYSITDERKQVVDFSLAATTTSSRPSSTAEGLQGRRRHERWPTSRA